MIHTLEMTVKDIEAIKELQPDGWQDILAPFLFYLHSPFCNPLKFILNNRIVGIGCHIRHHSTAWLAHIIVHKDYRNKGIGTSVTKTLLERANKSRSSTISLIATELGRTVYKKLGFKEETEYHFYKKETYISQGSDTGHIRSNALEFDGDIMDMDKAVSGENRAHLLREHLKEAKVFISKGKLRGFYLPDLGDGLIAASDDEAGIALLKLRLERIPVVVIPESNTAAAAFLKENNFSLFKTGTRMRLGQEIPFKGPMLFSRIGGNMG